MYFNDFHLYIFRISSLTPDKNLNLLNYFASLHSTIMEGTYLPSHRRSKIVKEVRKTHFHLGSDQNQFKTTNFSDYKTNKLTVQQVHPINNISHVQLSSDKRERFITEFSSKFRSASEEPRVSSFKPVPAIALNASPGIYTTTSSNSYKKVEKIRPSPKSYRLVDDKKNKHSFEMGTGTPIEYKSTMKNDFLYKAPRDKGLSAKEIKMKYGNSHNLNEKVGVYATESLSEYRQYKSESPAKLVRVNEIDSIRYSETGNELLTTNMTHYYVKKTENASLSTEKLGELKSSHLNFGNSPTNFTKSSLQHSPIYSKISIVKKSHPESSISFGQDASDSKSNYSTFFTSKPAARSASIELEKKNSQNISSVNLGVVKNSYVTEHNAVHKLLNESPGRLSPDAEKTLKTHHFTLGNESPDYQSTSSNYGKVNKHLKRMDMLLTKVSTNHSNWSFGNYPTQKKSEVQQEYQWKGTQAELNPNKSDKNKCHFQLGSKPTTWSSNYNSNFGWINPVPDTEYKISLMK